MKHGRKPLNLAGQRFGKLVAIERVGTKISPKSALWRCRCDCGADTVIGADDIRARREPCCEACTKPILGVSKDSAYLSWRAMLARCYLSYTHGYYLYGGRGVRVCKRWRESFFDFLADVGPKPSAEHWLGRIDHDGHYEPGNVRWETRDEQLRNRRTHNQARFAPVTRMVSQ